VSVRKDFPAVNVLIGHDLILGEGFEDDRKEVFTIARCFDRVVQGSVFAYRKVDKAVDIAFPDNVFRSGLQRLRLFGVFKRQTGYCSRIGLGSCRCLCGRSGWLGRIGLSRQVAQAEAESQCEGEADGIAKGMHRFECLIDDYFHG